MLCIVCHQETPSAHGVGRPRKYCSTACRQRACRQRHQHVSGGVGSTCRPAPTHRGGDGAAQVVAVLYLPAAMAEKIEQKADAGLVLELGILGVAHIHPGAAARPHEPDSVDDG